MVGLNSKCKNDVHAFSYGLMLSLDIRELTYMNMKIRINEDKALCFENGAQEYCTTIRDDGNYHVNSKIIFDYGGNTDTLKKIKSHFSNVIID